MILCLPGGFLSCLVAVGFTGDILRSTCKNFLGSAVSSTFKVGVGGASASAKVASGMMTGSCLGGSPRAHSVWEGLIFSLRTVSVRDRYRICTYTQ